MHRAVAKRMICLALILAQFGCRSVYRFRCTCNPSPAGVVIGEQMMGETPCDVTIPRKSEMIQDGKVEFVFCLPDGPERTKIVDISRLKPSNPLAEIVAAPFVLVGVGLLVCFNTTKEDDDEHSWKKDNDQEDRGGNFLTVLVGLGFMGIGSGLHSLLGGHSESLSPYEVHMDFNEPVEPAESQAPGP